MIYRGLQRTRLSCGRMILLLAHPLPPSPTSKLDRQEDREIETTCQCLDPDWEVGFGSRQAEIGPQKGKKCRNFMFEESERPFVFY
jgi:hypothetical protein